MYLSFILKSILSVRLSDSLRESHVLLFSEFMNTVFIFGLHFYWIHYTVVYLYSFSVISFAWYKEYMICLISFNKISDGLLAFTWARAIGNLSSIYLVVNTFRPSPCFVLYVASDAILE